MSEIKNLIISIIIFVLWSVGMFFGGYLLCNRRAVEQLNKANTELAKQQQRYDNLIKQSEERIRETEQRISDIRTELLGKISDNGETAKELTGIIEQIRKQKLDIQI